MERKCCDCFCLPLKRNEMTKSCVESFLKSAATNTTARRGLADLNYIWDSPLELLIRKKSDRIKITEDVLATAAASPLNEKICVLVLLRYAKGRSTITENILCAAARNQEQGYDILTVLLVPPIYQKVVAAGVANDGYNIGGCNAMWEKLSSFCSGTMVAQFQFQNVSL